MSDRWMLRVGFDATQEVIDAWTVAVAKGGFWIRSETEPQADQLDLVLVAGLTALDPMKASVVRQPSPSGQKGFWIQPEPTDQVLELVGAACPAAPWVAVNRKVLVIDDEPIWRSALARVLKGLG